MANKKPIASFRTTITNAISSTATTIPIDKVTDDEGVTMDTLLLGFIIDKGTSAEEFVIGTVDAGGMQLTNVTRGVSVRDGQTSVTALKFAHRKKASIEITDHPYLVLALRQLDGTDSLEGIPKNPSSRTINNSRHLTDKEYVDSIAAAAGGITAFYVTDAGALTINIGSGYLATSDGVISYAGAAGTSVVDASTNYVEISNLGTVSVNQSSFTTGRLPLAIVTTSGGDITGVSDARAWLTAPQPERLVTTDYAYGETIAIGDAVYLDTADAKWKLADASAAATCPGNIAVALEAGVNNDTGKRVQVGGIVTGLSGLTVGTVYVSDTAGDFSATAGTYKKVVGRAINTTTLILSATFDPSLLEGSNSYSNLTNFNEAMGFFEFFYGTATAANAVTDGSNADTYHKHDIGALFDSSNSGSTITRIVPLLVNSNTTGVADDTSPLGMTLTGTATSNSYAASISLLTGDADKVALWSNGAAGGGTPTKGPLAFYNGGALTLDDQFTFRFQAIVDSSTGLDAWLGFDDETAATFPTTGVCMGFFKDGAVVYSKTSDGASTTQTDITSSITLNQWNDFRITRGVSSVTFYINGTLVATHTTNLPASGSAEFHIIAEDTGTGTDQKLALGTTGLLTHPRTF